MIPLPFSPWPLAVGVVVALGLALGVQSYRLNSCQAKKAEAIAAYTTLASKLTEQNAEVTKFEKATKSAQERAKKALKEAEILQQKRAKVTVAVERVPAPAVPGKCEDELATIGALFSAARRVQ